MKRVCLKNANGFDLLNSETETNTSLIRNSSKVQISWSDVNGLTQLKKQIPAITTIGTLLVTEGQYLKPTGDTRSKRTIAKLISLPTAQTETKQITINGIQETAYLLPVQLL